MRCGVLGMFSISPCVIHGTVTRIRIAPGIRCNRLLDQIQFFHHRLRSRQPPCHCSFPSDKRRFAMPGTAAKGQGVFFSETQMQMRKNILASSTASPTGAATPDCFAAYRPSLPPPPSPTRWTSAPESWKRRPPIRKRARAWLRSIKTHPWNPTGSRCKRGSIRLAPATIAFRCVRRVKR